MYRNIIGRSMGLGSVAIRLLLATVLGGLLAMPARADQAHGQGYETSGTVLSSHQQTGRDPYDVGFSPQRWRLLRPDLITYVVQPGDNDWSIARRYGLDVDTLRFSNEWLRLNPDLIFPGQEMVILPVKGAYVTVKEGDTVERIAARYGVDPQEIVEFPLNGLRDSDHLLAGQKLIVPGGRLDYAERILPPGPGTGYALAWPLRGTVSQGYHSGHKALDIGSYYGAMVYAGAAGRVTGAQFSPGGWLGFTVTIAHDNGLVTRYSHLSGILVERGQWVSRGQLIGKVGSTGNSTGPHVHFEVLQSGSVVNPRDLLPPSPAN